MNEGGERLRLLTTPAFFFFITLLLNDCHDFFCRSPAASMAANLSFFLAAFFLFFSISIRCFSRADLLLIPTSLSIVVDGSGANAEESSAQRLKQNKG